MAGPDDFSMDRSILTHEEQAYVPDFAWMMARHAKAARGYRLALTGMVIVGLAVAALGLVSPTLREPLLAAGLMLAALAVVPFKEMRERRERIEGLEVLQEEWADLAARDNAVERHEFFQLIARLYR